MQLPRLGQLAFTADGGVDAPQVRQGRCIRQPVQHLRSGQHTAMFMSSSSDGAKPESSTIEMLGPRLTLPTAPVHLQMGEQHHKAGLDARWGM